MRILIVTNNYTPYSGGVVSSLNAVIPALQRAGHEVVLVAPQFLATHADDPTWVRRVPSLVRFTWHNNRMALPWRMKQNVSKIMQAFKPDVVHVQHPFLLGEVARTVAHAKGIRVVFTYHTLYESYAHYVPLPQPLVKKIITARVQRFCNKVDTVIAPSQGVRDALDARGVMSTVVVIPSPLQDLFLHQLSPQERNDGRLVLLTVGRFVPEKNMHAVLELYAQLPRERFRLVLIGYGTLYESLQHYAYTTLKCSHSDVQFVHKPSQSVIAHWYANADIFLFTSQTDTQGLVLAEAMAGGLPVVALPGVGQQEIVRDGVNGYICASISDMREKLLLLAGNQEMLNVLSQGAKHTSKNYTSDKIVQDVVYLYQQLAK